MTSGFEKLEKSIFLLQQMVILAVDMRMFAGKRSQESGHMGNGKTNQQELWYQPKMMQDDVGMGQHGDPMSN